MGTVPVPYSPIAGDDATQARVLTWADAANYLLGNATSGGSKRALAVMRQTVTQSLATATPTAITLDTEDVDYDNGHSTVTNPSRYTAATTGWYDVTGYVAFASNATGERDVWLKINGTTHVPGTQVTVAASAVSATQLATPTRKVFLNAGDYIELFAQQTSGAALGTVVGAPAMPTLNVEWRSN